MIDLHRLNNYSNPEYSDVFFDQNRVRLSYQNKWTHRGHTINQGMSSTDGHHFYLNISKNNSSFVKTVLQDLDWQFSMLDEHLDNQQPQILVVLRDPVDRWISGIVEYLFLYHLDIIDRSGFYCPEMGYQRMLGQTLALDLLVKNVAFDDHTERQCVFLQGVDLSRVTWFDAKQNFNETFTCFLRDLGYIIDLKDAEPVNQDVDTAEFSFHNKRRHMKRLIRDYLESFPDIKASIRRFYACDYYLMESVSYYGS
jgi:hypothetical protein